MSGSTLSSEGLDLRRRKVLFRSWHRGTREMDLVMGRFLDTVLPALSEAELAEVEAWIELPDPLLYAWITGEERVPAQYDTPLFRRWIAFHGG
ncbi:MAG TPA: succinate dehydrogenase assembly factor 2 [Xanthobacteraceae bacterium]|nr:succinate dehydrogenase assembly factor 2 [Xanthobacteraceae bacterium]